MNSDLGDMILRHNDAGEGVIEEHIDSFVALKGRFEDIAREYEPIVGVHYSVDLVRRDLGVLSVGLGSDLWILSFLPTEDGAPKYSLGDSNASGSIPFYFGDHTLMSKKYLISKEYALEAVRVWWEDGVLSDKINWTEENFGV